VLVIEFPHARRKVCDVIGKEPNCLQEFKVWLYSLRIEAGVDQLHWLIEKVVKVKDDGARVLGWSDS
jgi:hypothetical protein